MGLGLGLGSRTDLTLALALALALTLTLRRWVYARWLAEAFYESIAITLVIRVRVGG